MRAAVFGWPPGYARRDDGSELAIAVSDAARLAGNQWLSWHDQAVRTQASIGWLTIRLTEPNARRLNTALTTIVKRAHACGLKAATIAHQRGDLPVPRQEPRQISLPDGVTGTVTVADERGKLREFVVQISDLLGPDATVEIDGTVVAIQRQPVGS